MARWDEILSLPVQNPPTLEFSAADIVWSKVEGWRDNIDRVALIPFARVDDFVRGESSNKDCPTRFHVEARRRRPPQMSCKAKVDGILEYILYWCSFGPDDHRKGGIVRPSRTSYAPKKNKAGRPNTKRGCTCHFIVKRLIAEPSVALVIYNQDKHVDKKGVPCHGPQDSKAKGTRAMFAPYISEDLRLRVLSLLYVGVSVETIMQRHYESVERQGGPSNRDDLLTHRYVRRQERSIRRSSHELDADDAVSVNMWVETHQSHAFFYEDFSDSGPFVLGIQTEWQLQQMIRFGNRSLMASDSRFGTDKLKYPVHSLLVFNSENKAIPVAWIITPRFASADAHRWMRALYNRVCMKDPAWKLAGFIVDDPLTDIFTIRDVFQCSVLISFWRVRHSWHKNLVKRCLETEMRVQMSKRLGTAVDHFFRGQGSMDLFEAFMEDFVDGSHFIDYFKAVWYPRIGMWITALKTLPLASQETSAAMEFYHNQVKIRLLNEKDTSVYQRSDWLVDKLGTKVHSYFWLDEYSEKDHFARYWKEEWASGLTSWRKALKIPDADVVLEGGFAKVTDQLNRDRIHVVWNPGSDFAICDCNWAEGGNLCEHVIKVIRICRNAGYSKSSVSLSQYNRALIDMLHCPPFDSLIRDHAVSLAVVVRKQLEILVDIGGSWTTVEANQNQTANSLEQQKSRPDSSHQDRECGDESHPIDQNVAFHNRSNCNDRNVASGSVTDDFVSTDGEEITGAKMDVDLSSVCAPPPKLHSINMVVSNGLVSDSGGSTTNILDSDSSKTQIPSNESSLTDLFPCEKDSAIGVELSATSVPPPSSFDQHAATNQNDVCCTNPIDPDLSQDMPTEVGALTDPVQCAKDDVIGVEPMAIDVPSSTSSVQCQPSNQNDVCCSGADTSVVGKLADSSSLSDKISLTSTEVVDSQMVAGTETSGAIGHSEVAEAPSEGGSKSENCCSSDGVSLLAGIQDSNVTDATLYPDTNPVEIAVEAESLQGSSSPSRCNDEQPSGKAAGEATCSSGKRASSITLVSTRNKLQKCSENGRILGDTKDQADVVKGIMSEGTMPEETAKDHLDAVKGTMTEGTGSVETAKAILASEASRKPHQDVVLASCED